MPPIISLYLGVFLLSSFALAVDVIDLPDGIELDANNVTAVRHTLAPSWVPSPRFRGTLDILWSCIVTLIASVYTALHLNVPTNSGLAAVVFTKTRWTLLSLLAPELVIYFAYRQFQEARSLRRKLLGAIQHSPAIVPADFNCDLKFCYFVVMGGFRVCMNNNLTELQQHEKPIYQTITSKGILSLVDEGLFPTVPNHRIEDKSKSNVFQKLLVFIQIFWMALQCIVRASKNLPLAILEVHTLTHVFFAIILIFLWIEKPLDIHDAEIIPTSNLLSSWVRAHSRTNNDFFRTTLRGFGGDNLGGMSDDMFEKWPLALAALLPALYGGVHLATGLNSKLPTGVEQTIWKAASVIIIAFIPTALCIVIPAFYVGERKNHTHQKGLGWVFDWLMVIYLPVGTIVYVLARLFIIIESFISLRAEPIGVYIIPAWLQMLPHL